MTVPEAAVDEDGSPVLAHNDVGRTGESLHIYPVAVASGMQVAAHKQFGPGILALDARHAPVPLLFCHPVCHNVRELVIYSFTTATLITPSSLFSKIR